MEVSVFFALLYIPWLQGVLSADIKNNLKYFEVIHAKSFGHNIVKRGIHPSDHPFNKIREVNFKVRNKRIFSSRLYIVLSTSSSNEFRISFYDFPNRSYCFDENNNNK